MDNEIIKFKCGSHVCIVHRYPQSSLVSHELVLAWRLAAGVGPWLLPPPWAFTHGGSLLTASEWPRLQEGPIVTVQSVWWMCPSSCLQFLRSVCSQAVARSLPHVHAPPLSFLQTSGHKAREESRDERLARLNPIPLRPELHSGGSGGF